MSTVYIQINNRWLQTTKHVLSREKKNVTSESFPRVVILLHSTI
uniref:Uncharacterized protein n=1 Tax=Arundo donax TaxID=35708 RepID=A0A0A9BSN0_ARUDO